MDSSYYAVFSDVWGRIYNHSAPGIREMSNFIARCSYLLKGRNYDH